MMANHDKDQYIISYTEGDGKPVRVTTAFARSASDAGDDFDFYLPGLQILLIETLAEYETRTGQKYKEI